MHVLAKLFLCCVVSIALHTAAPLTATTFASEQHGGEFSPFQPSDNAMADVDALLADAARQEKLAMIILGANWCHDSIGFIRHLASEAVSQVVSARYVTKTIDVGYLEHGRDIVTRFGLKVIYGTPTVLIVEPTSGQLLNRGSLHRWRDAAAMKEEEVIALLSSQQVAPARARQAEGELKRLLDEIDAFEAIQAARIYEGFSIIGPMLAAEDRPAEFGHYWGQLRDLRYSITGDLARLRGEARKRVAAGETAIQLDFPEYAPFDWE